MSKLAPIKRSSAMRSARVNTQAAGTKRTRGRPFGSGPDPRRNVKGRGKRKEQDDPYQIALAALLAPVVTITNGRRQKKPRLQVVLEQQLVAAAQGDQSAVKTAATMLRAVNALRKGPQVEQPLSKPTVHDEKALERIIKDFEQHTVEAEAARRNNAKRESQG